MRLLFTIPDEPSIELMYTVLDSALSLTCLNVEVSEARTLPQLLNRVDANEADVIMLDWHIAHNKTPDLVRQILTRNPLLRVVVLLPEHYRQYRQSVWDAGACNGIPKEHIDQEWLSTVLCIMYRAMQREARFLSSELMGD